MADEFVYCYCGEGYPKGSGVAREIEKEAAERERMDFALRAALSDLKKIHRPNKYVRGAIQDIEKGLDG